VNSKFPNPIATPASGGPELRFMHTRHGPAEAGPHEYLYSTPRLP
jgi:hypothetical protein